MKLINDVSKTVCKSLSFLDNQTVRLVLIAVVILYAAGIAPNLSAAVSSVMDSSLIKLVMLVVILCVSTRDTTLALMLTIALLLSLQVNARNQVNNSINEGMANSKQQLKQQPNEEDEDKKEQMSNLAGAPAGSNTPDSCLQEGATCSGDLSNPCTGIQAWASENNAQGLVCNSVRGYSNNDYQGASF